MNYLIQFCRRPPHRPAIRAFAWALLVMVTLAFGLRLFGLQSWAVVVAARVSGALRAAHDFAGWTLFAFAPMAFAILHFGSKRFSGGLSDSDRRWIELIEVLAYGVGLLGSISNLRVASQTSGLGFSSAMACFHPLEIGIGFWIACQIVSFSPTGRFRDHSADA